MTKQPQWLDNAVFYEIYPQSFMTQTQTASVISRVLQKSLTISASWGVTLFG